ncbi:protein SRG1 [Trifolium repens]|nr:protein SRG1 [Trifolium repens]
MELTVPFVQELAKEALTKVPDRYVRLHQDRPILSSSSATTPLPQLPVIDLSKLLSHDLNQPELKKLHYACKEWGFFQLINHGVSGSLVENVKKGAEEFFNLPMEEKKKFEQREGDVQGYGQAFVVSEEQKLDWADMFFLFTLPSHIRKPHLFPSIPLPFRVDLETYCEELRTLAIQILDLMAYSLAIDPAEIRELFDQATQSTRMNYYPPCNDVEGLQIKKDGLWIPVKPLPNAFIINLGDMLEMATNGIYRSIEHRAMVNSEKERFSIATFYSPALNTIMNPAPSLVTPNTPAVFKRISAGEYFKGYLAQELRGKSFLNSIRVQTENDQKPSELYD